MIENDVKYFRICLDANLIKAPFLEIGSGIRQEGREKNLCEYTREYGITPAFGTDLYPGGGVDFTADFGLAPKEFKEKWLHGMYRAVAIFNTLEHTFDPITVLYNATQCVEPQGILLVVAPSVWGLHDYPKDYVRLMPHWYEEFADRFGLNVIRKYFVFISEFGIIPIDSLTAGTQYNLPNYLNSARKMSPQRYWTSRIIHRLFNTYGRSHRLPHATIGCCFKVEALRAY